MSKLQDYCLAITDGEHGSVSDDPQGQFYFLNNNNITSEGVVVRSTDRRISEESFLKIRERTHLEVGDLLIATCGTLGKTCVINETPSNYEFSRSVGMIKVDKNKLYPEYLHYFFSLPTSQHRIAQLAKGGVQKHFYISDMEDFDFEAPPLAIQKRIVDVLAPIDNKIANNNVMREHLEAIAKALYNFWFVQFNYPDDNGNPYKSSGGKMVWCEELRQEIPAEWDVKRIADVASLQTVSVFPERYQRYHHYSIPAFDEARLPSPESGETIASAKYVVPKNSVLVSKLNPQFRRIWLVPNPTTNAICSTEFLPIVAKETGLYYLYALLGCDAFAIHLCQKASSSTGSRKRIDPDNCMSFTFAYNAAVASTFDQIVQPLFKKATNCIVENWQLSSYRDFLLPMLMNGQIVIDGESKS